MERSPGRTADAARQVAVLITALAQPVVTIVVFSGRGYSEVFGDSGVESPMVPASFAFMIWTAIFAGALGLAAYQALPSQRRDRLMRATGWPIAAGFLATNLWLAAAAAQRAWLTVILILVIFTGLLLAQRVLARGQPSPAQRQFVVVPISVYLGWLSVAMFANVASAASGAGPAVAVLAGAPGAVVLVIAACALAVTLLGKGIGNRWYAGAVAWALAGILAANLDTAYGRLRPAVAVAAAAALLGVLLAAIRWSPGPVDPAPPSAES